MKKITWFSIIATLLLLLNACGPSEKTFTATSGLSVTAKDTWVEASGEEAKKLIDSDDADIATMVIALINNSDGAYLTIDRHSASGVKSIWDDLIFNLNDAYPGDLNAAVEYLKENDYTDREIELLTPILEGNELPEDEMNYLYQELNLQDWMYSLRTEDTTSSFSFDSIDETTIDGKKAQVFHYRYTNSDGTALILQESHVIVGTSVYYIVTWSEDNSAEKMAAELKAMRESIVFP